MFCGNLVCGCGIVISVVMLVGVVMLLSLWNRLFLRYSVLILGNCCVSIVIFLLLSVDFVSSKVSG